MKESYRNIAENIDETPELFHYDYYKLKGGELYYIGKRKPLMAEGKLRPVGMLADILGKNRLHRLDFNIPVGKVTARHCKMVESQSDTFKIPSRGISNIIIR